MNHLERAALSTNVLTLLLGLGLFTNENAGRDGKSDAFATFLTVCILVLNIFFFLSVMHTLAKYSTLNLCKKKPRPERQIGDTAVPPFVVVPAAPPITTGAHRDTKPSSQLENTRLKKQVATLKWQHSVKNKLKNNTTNTKRMNRVKSTRTIKVEEIQKNHQTHRNMALTKIQKQQTTRRNSLQLRVQARTKVKHSKALLNSSYFSNLQPASIAKIIDAMDFEMIEEHHTDICRQGDVADIFYIIIAGACQVSIDGEAIALLGELDIFGESALFPDGDGKSVRGATVSTTDQIVQVLALPRKKFNNLLVSGTFNEDCIEKLRKVAEARKEKNSNLQVNIPEVESIRVMLGKTIKNSIQFRKIVRKMNKKMSDGDMDGNTMVKKKNFVVIVEKIMVKKKLKVEGKCIDDLWMSVGENMADEVSCKVLEVWMGLL